MWNWAAGDSPNSGCRDDDSVGKIDWPTSIKEMIKQDEGCEGENGRRLLCPRHLQYTISKSEIIRRGFTPTKEDEASEAIHVNEQ